MQTLGLSGSSSGGGSRIRELFWPKIDDEIAAVTAARNAMYACFWIALSTAVLGLAGDQGWQLWIDVAIYVLVGIGVRQLSLAAGLIGFIVYGLSWTAAILAVSPSGYMAPVQLGLLVVTTVVRLMLTALLVQGVRAAAYAKTAHRAETIETIANPEFAGQSAADDFWERLPKRLWPALRAPFFIVLSLLLFVNLMTLSAFSFVQYWVQTTGSMEDTLLLGDRVASIRASFMGTVQRGDILVFRYPVDLRQVFLKRVVGLPGDRIRISGKQLYINGTKAVEPYVKHTTDDLVAYRDEFPSQETGGPFVFPQAAAMLAQDVRDGEVIVPSGRYFVLGDNRDLSLDSRYWGFVRTSDILGRAWIITLSYDKDVRRPGRTLVRIERFPLAAR